MTAAKRISDDVSALFRARNSLLWIVSREEARVERGLADAAISASYEPRFWDCATGISDVGGAILDAQARDPQSVLDAVRDSRRREVWILRDLHLWLRDPTILRAVRSLARALPSYPRAEARALVVLSPSGEIPPELAGHALVLDWPIPDRDEVAEILDAAVENLPEDVERPANGVREAAVDAAVGLNGEEIAACFAKSLVTSRRIDPVAIAAEKRRVVSRERVLEWIDSDPRGLNAVGGLDALKDWLVRRRLALSQKARAFGLPAPKGCLLVGVPGCGKSLTAKAVSAAWNVPLLRLDLGALKSKWVGESEGNLRRALKTAEAVAPCVLWLDEVEKALAGSTGPQGDGGVAADALGAVLGWLQERAGSVFVVATANDVRALPPELLRKGRFDEVFWVDLPSVAERAAILTVAIKKHGRDSATVDTACVAEAAQDFTGSEIAELVPDALFEAFADGERALTTGDLLASAKRVVPLAKTACEKIDALRAWAKGRARPATTPISPDGVKRGRELDV